MHELLPDYQSAYRSNRSCETALLKLVNDILWNMEKAEVSALVAIDLSAAFDTVSHTILLDILSKRFGMSGTVLKWTDSYLKPRDFSVIVNGHRSNPRALPFGVPQGSLLGPFYYLAYASPMEQVVRPEIDIYGFADDHGLRKSFIPSPENELDALSQLRDCLTDIKNWMDSCRLQMNCSKTEFIKFGHKKQLTKCPANSINVCGDEIQKTRVVRYLGAWLDETMSFEEHVKIKCKSAMLNLFRIKSIANVLSRDTLIVLTLMLVISHLDYANCLLIGIPKYLLARLQNIQNMAAKLVCNKRKFDSATACLKELHWLPISFRVEFKCLCVVYKSLKGQAPMYLQKLFKLKDKSNYGLRSNSKILELDVPRTKRKTFADRSISVAGAKMWNALPNCIKESENLEIFKKNVKTYLFRQAFNCTAP